MSRPYRFANVVWLLVTRTGVSTPDAIRAVEAVGPDYYRAVEWLRVNTRMGT